MFFVTADPEKEEQKQNDERRVNMENSHPNCPRTQVPARTEHLPSELESIV